MAAFEQSKNAIKTKWDVIGTGMIRKANSQWKRHLYLAYLMELNYCLKPTNWPGVCIQWCMSWSWIIASNPLTDQAYALSDVPHGADDVRLSELYNNGAAAKLVTRVAWVPVIVLCVAVDQCVATTTHSLNHTRAALHCCHVFRSHCNEKYTHN